MEKKEYSIDYHPAKISRRLASAAIDFLLTAICGIIFIFFAILIVDSNPGFNDIRDTRNNELIASQLYVMKGGIAVRLIDEVDEDTNLTNNQRSEKLDNSLTYFFTSFINEELNGEGLNIYNKYKEEAFLKENNLPIFDENYQRIYVTNDYDRVYYDFYYNTYIYSLNYLSLDATYQEATLLFNIIYILSMAFAVIIAVFIFYFIIPLCVTRGKKSVGMLIMKLGVVGANGLSCSWKRFTLRFIFILLFEIIGSVFAFLIPLAISFTFLLFSKTKQTLHDYLFTTYVIDAEETNIYKDTNEFMIANRDAIETKIESINSIFND